MHIPWKKVGSILLGIGRSGLVPIPGLPAAIEGVEAAIGSGKGGDKLAMVSQIADALLSETAVLTDLTEAQSAELTALKTAYISDYVEIRNLEAKIEHDAQALKDFIATLKKAPAAA